MIAEKETKIKDGPSAIEITIGNGTLKHADHLRELKALQVRIQTARHKVTITSSQIDLLNEALLSLAASEVRATKAKAAEKKRSWLVHLATSLGSAASFGLITLSVMPAATLIAVISSVIGFALGDRVSTWIDDAETAKRAEGSGIINGSSDLS